MNELITHLFHDAFVLEVPLYARELLQFQQFSLFYGQFFRQSLICNGPCSEKYSAVPLQPGQFSQKYSLKTPYSSPVRASYGVSVVDAVSDRYSASVSVITDIISYNIGPRL